MENSSWNPKPSDTALMVKKKSPKCVPQQTMWSLVEKGKFSQPTFYDQ